MHGAALVLADITTFRELWHDAALFVPADDAAGFAAAFDRLAAEPALRRRLAARARERAGRFTLERQVAQVRQAYAAALATQAQLARADTACASSSTPTRWCPTGTTATRISCAACCANCRRAATRRWRWSRTTDGAARTCSRRKAAAAVEGFAPRLSRTCASAPTTPVSTMRRASTTPTWCIVHEWTEPALGRAPRQIRRQGGSVHACCSTTRITAPSRMPPRSPICARRLRRRARLRRRSAPSAISARLGATGVHLARGGGHAAVPPAPAPRNSPTTWSGSATGATASARRNCASS